MVTTILKIKIFYSLAEIRKSKTVNVMSKVCQLTGKRPITGNNVSHSHIRTKRKFYPNLQTKKFYIPEEDRWITLKVSAAGIRTINKKGISVALKDAKDKGYYTG